MSQHRATTEERREELLGILRDTISTSWDKFDKIKASNKDRQSWARIIISACDSYNKILGEIEISQLWDKVNELEKLIEARGNE